MRRRDADILMLTRAAYHADEINKLMAELTKFDQKEAPGIGPEQLIGMMKGAG